MPVPKSSISGVLELIASKNLTYSSSCLQGDDKFLLVKLLVSKSMENNPFCWHFFFFFNLQRYRGHWSKSKLKIQVECYEIVNIIRGKQYSVCTAAVIRP